MIRAQTLKLLGIEADHVSHTEKILSAAGGFAGILALFNNDDLRVLFQEMHDAQQDILDEVTM